MIPAKTLCTEFLKIGTQRHEYIVLSHDSANTQSIEINLFIIKICLQNFAFTTNIPAEFYLQDNFD